MKQKPQLLSKLVALAFAALAISPMIVRADDTLSGTDGRDFRFYDRIALTSGSAAPTLIDAQAAINVRDESTGRVDQFVLAGLPAGTYTVSAVTLSGTVPVDFPVTVSGTSETVLSGTDLPVGLDVLDIATFSLSGTQGEVASGDFLGVNYVEGADHVAGKIHVNKKDTDLVNTTVQSHLVINGRIQKGAPRALCQLQLSGLPASTTVTLAVNGTPLGDFTTDSHGSLKLKRTPGKGKSHGPGKAGLPSNLDVFSIRTISVLDSLSNPYIEVNLRD